MRCSVAIGISLCLSLHTFALGGELNLDHDLNRSVVLRADSALRSIRATELLGRNEGCECRADKENLIRSELGPCALRRMNLDAMDASEAVYEMYDLLHPKAKLLIDASTGSKPLRGKLPGPELQRFAPAGYEVAEVFDDGLKTLLPDGRSPKGTFAVLFTPKDPSKAPIFAIKGSASFQDWEKNMTGRIADYLGRLHDAVRADGTPLFASLRAHVRSKGDIIFAGHSQGGALAQGMSYLLQGTVTNPGSVVSQRGKVRVITESAAGGTQPVETYLSRLKQKRDPRFESFKSQSVRADLESGIYASNFYPKGDLVGSVYRHIGGATRMEIGVPDSASMFELHSISTTRKLLDQDYERIAENLMSLLRSDRAKLRLLASNKNADKDREAIHQRGKLIRSRIMEIEQLLKAHPSCKLHEYKIKNVTGE